MGFAEGLKVGGGLVSQALENERLTEAAKRQEEEFARKKVGWEREDEKYNATRAAMDEYRMADQGATPEVRSQIAEQYNLSPEQMARASQMPGGLPARLKTLDTTNWDGTTRVAGTPAPPMPGDAPAPAGGLNLGAAVPEAGAAPAPVRTAADVKFAPDPVAREKALRGVAVASGDVNAIRQSHDAERVEGLRAVATKVSKMKTEDLVSQGKEANLSGLRMVYSGKTKDGKYQFTTYDKTGEPTQHDLSEPQLRQLALARAQADAGFGAESLTTLSGLGKEFTELMDKQNQQTGRNVTSANDAQAKSAHDANAAAQLGISAGHLALARSKAEMEKMGNAETFVDPKTGDTYKTYMQTGKGNVPEQVAFKLGTNGVGSMQKVDKLPGGLQHVGGKGGAGGADKQLPGEDTIMQRPDKTTYKPSPQGYELDIKAPKVQDRVALLQKAGLPPAVAEAAEWSNDGPLAGRIVRMNGKFYDVAKPEHLTAMVKDRAEQERSESKTDQMARMYQGNRFAYEHPELAAQQERDRQSYAGFLADTEGGAFPIGAGR